MNSLIFVKLAFQPAAIAIGSTPRASNTQNGYGMDARGVKRPLSPPADNAEHAAKDDAAKAKTRRVTSKRDLNFTEFSLFQNISISLEILGYFLCKIDTFFKCLFSS